VFQASVVGKPPQEDKFMGEAVQEFFAGVLRVIHPEVVDLWAYFEAGFHNLLAVAVENRFAREARKTALGLLGTGQLSLTKCVVLVDEDVNPRDRAGRVRRDRAQLRSGRGLPADPGVPLDTLDFTSYTMNLGSKMVIDAQTKGRAVGSAGVSPTGAATAVPPAPPDAASLLDPRTVDAAVLDWRLAWGAMLVVKTRGEGQALVPALVRRREYRALKFIVAVSEDVAARRRRAAALGHLHALRLRARHRAVRGRGPAARGRRCTARSASTRRGSAATPSRSDPGRGRRAGRRLVGPRLEQFVTERQG
jgi:4-hydroxy-3-polyprenylbenzoate decarboxylase